MIHEKSSWDSALLERLLGSWRLARRSCSHESFSLFLHFCSGLTQTGVDIFKNLLAFALSDFYDVEYSIANPKSVSSRTRGVRHEAQGNFV
ncbi:uncharacterized protein PHALS_07317 [Plasmopara halstedii]|uniref:Uncharacterized protein n=1 Tax=Plasmopara halstedii TaxID=4781 RepID=A0A0P1B5E4_PLAHL|nr:uncharacterized protein PHALS_07317 [Plasmopara halstedii]CEG49559.1 hypothetical protein PHALS_07317 [Plasmopara halstedii]|eukprot:XP_024585928.1 hypothetical protein PHALS_07317 [Plasmopara halstedii]